MGHCFSVRRNGPVPTTGANCPAHSRTEEENFQLRRFPFNDLNKATRNFETKLGRGAFGYVYKGRINEVDVAVKRLNDDSAQGNRELQTEVNFLGKLRHPNLVKLVGYCSEEHHQLLVYQYMPERSLDIHLFKGGELPWDIRMKIILGAAEGLAFLHSPPNKILFRDFKTANILLDSDFSAKISDFGFAREGPTGDNSHVTTRRMGTDSYAAPEFLSTGHLKWNCDVYSFGIVLLEILTGKRMMYYPDIIRMVKSSVLNEENVSKLIDESLRGQNTYGHLAVAQLAKLCISDIPMCRPDMLKVVECLKSVQRSGGQKE